MLKKSILLVVCLTLALPLFAGGKSCDMKAVKNVELTGTLTTGGEHAVFHVANSDKSYTVCEKTKDAVLKLGNEGHDTLKVKGKVVNCGGGEELLIDTANKI